MVPRLEVDRLESVRDTSPLADQARLAAIRRLDPVERLRQAFELSEAMRELALTRLRAEHPGYPERELVERWMGHTLPTGP